MRTATLWLSQVRNEDPKKLAFFTGRDQSQALTGWWAAQFGTPNYAAHGGFCSVNMAAAGLYTFGGSFWEFGEPDWQRTRYFLLFGVAEDHASNPIKIGLGHLKRRGVKVVSVNPVRTGYSAIADEWLGIRPGTDGLFVAALIHELLRTDCVDFDYLVRYTNAHWLVIDAPGAPEDGLFARDPDGNPLAADALGGPPLDANLPGISPRLTGEASLGGRRARPAFELLARRFLDTAWAPEAVAARCGIKAETIRRIAAELADAAFRQEIAIDVPWTDYAGRRHDRMVGRPVSMHAMRGISAHSNGFHTCRLIHVLQILLGTIDVPGGYRYKAPYPRPIPPGIKPAGKPGQVHPNAPLAGPPLGFVQGPEDLIIDGRGPALPHRQGLFMGGAARCPWPHAHGHRQRRAPRSLRHRCAAAVHGQHELEFGHEHRGDGSRSHRSRDGRGGEYVIPKIIYSDAYYSEMVAYADLILPDTTYLERWDCISLLDRPISEADGPADAIRRPVVEPRREVRGFQSVLLDLGARLGLPGMANADGTPRYPGGYADYIVNHERAPGLGPLAGFRGSDGSKSGKGEPNPDQLQRYIDNGCYWFHELPDHMKFYRHANRDYLEWATEFGFLPNARPIVFQLYSEHMQKFRLAARGHGTVQPPDVHRPRIEAYFDPLPFWYPPLEDELIPAAEFPLHAVTQRPMAMYHSWGSQNAWLRQIIGRNWLYLSDERADELGVADGDWVWVVSHHGRIKVEAKRMNGVNRDTVWTWNAIGKRPGAWNLAPDAPESRQGFLLNHLIGELLPAREGGYRYSNSDPVTGQAAWYDLRVRIEKAEEGSSLSLPQSAPVVVPPGLGSRPAVVTGGRAP